MPPTAWSRQYRIDVERLQSLVPDLDLTLWPHFDHGGAVSRSSVAAENSPTVRP